MKCQFAFALREKCPYLKYVGKHGLEKLRIMALFMQCCLWHGGTTIWHFSWYQKKIFGKIYFVMKPWYFTSLEICLSNLIHRRSQDLHKQQTGETCSSCEHRTSVHRYIARLSILDICGRPSLRLCGKTSQ